MGRSGRPSNGMECLGELPSKALCTLARDGSGNPIVLNKLCWGCGEQRCRRHCKCARDKTANSKGRKAARSSVGNKVAVSSQKEPPRAASLAPVVAPVGRASPASNELLAAGEWYRQGCSDLKDAAEAELATYMFDHTLTYNTLLKGLKRRAPLKLNLYIDSEVLAGAKPRQQRTRLKTLRDNGARVFVCKGIKKKGLFHGKAMVVDRRYLYSGGANFTDNSENNFEFCFRMTGSVVKQVLESLAGARQTGRLWDGK